MEKKNCILHVVGNRPQFIKLAAVSRELRKRGYVEVIIHSGQHYDANMSEIFFNELDIPIPDENLQIGSGSHTKITAECMIKLEEILKKYNPKTVLVYGDTNTTLAAALTCAKMNIPVCHVEAGSRFFLEQTENPEECNRILVDHISTILFSIDNDAVSCLKKENITRNVYEVGDTMYDTYLFSREKAVSMDEIYKKCNVQKEEFILMTWHRQENTASKEIMYSMLKIIQALEIPIICPMHPRTRKCLENFSLWEEVEKQKKFHVIEPLGYFEIIGLLKDCKLVVTDSGGLSKEAFYEKKKCVYTMNVKIWPKVEDSGSMIHTNIADIKEISRINSFIEKDVDMYNMPNFYGDGHAAEKIVNILEKYYGE